MFQTIYNRSSWGRTLSCKEFVAKPFFEDSLSGYLTNRQNLSMSTLASGMGRSYGDCGQNDNNAILSMTGMDRIIQFDPIKGRVRVEAGMTIDRLLEVIVPTGWFLPTTPGTRFVSIGGAVANDVHGKNHHRAGSIGCWITRIGLYHSIQGDLELTPDQDSSRFNATIGGLGLTGIIKWVDIKLAAISSSFLETNTIAFNNLEEYFRLSQEQSENHEHVVAWFDCVGGQSDESVAGRGLLSCSNWLTDGRLQVHSTNNRMTLPFNLPTFALNQTTLKTFNRLYFKRGVKNQGKTLEHYSTVFYPLDGLQQWNRLYGRNGFYQFQVIFSPDVALVAIRKLIRVISKSGQGSFLTTLKSLGPRQSPGVMSFPKEGTTLAMDFQNKGKETLNLLEQLHTIALQYNGRIYPAKDATMSRTHFQVSYKNELSDFLPYRDEALSSSFWRRVGA